MLEGGIDTPGGAPLAAVVGKLTLTRLPGAVALLL